MASPFTPDQVAWLQTTFGSATIPLIDIAASTESGWCGDCRLSFRHSSGDECWPATASFCISQGRCLSPAFAAPAAEYNCLIIRALQSRPLQSHCCPPPENRQKDTRSGVCRDGRDISRRPPPPPPQHTPGQPPLPVRPPILNISVWIEKYSVMLSSRFPEKAPELFAYQASIVRAERNFDDRR